MTIEVGDAREIVKTIGGSVDLRFLDCGFASDQPSYLGISGSIYAERTVQKWKPWPNNEMRTPPGNRAELPAKT